MSSEGRGMSRCAARLCTNNSKNSICSFFKFPKAYERARIWAIASDREDILNKENLSNLSYRICGMHFEDSMFSNASHNRLAKDAVPTLFPLLESTSTIISEKKSYQDEAGNKYLSSPDILPPSPIGNTVISVPPQGSSTPASRRENNLKRKLKQLENVRYNLHKKIRKMEESASLPENITLEEYKTLTYKVCPSKELADFINIQVSQSIKKPKGRRYSDEYKNYCLMLYFTGPKLYKSKLMKTFCLPSVSTLQKFIQHIRLGPGINDLLFEMFKKKTDNFRKLDKICILCVDEISIKANLFYGTSTDKIIGFEDMGGENKREFKPAHAATVVMARGLCANWKQPIAYYLVNSTCPGKTLKEIILNIILKLNEIGMTVVGVVSDMGSNNIQLSKLLNVSPESPYFYHNDQKIVFLFDIPHLLKALRNNFMKYKFVISGMLVIWEFIKIFYEHDKQYSVRAAPKLTDAHISPGNFQKMKVKFASQIFSNTVAVGLNLYIRFGKLPSEAKATEEFIRKINNLFDMLNSSSNVAPTMYQQAYKGTDEQKQYLLECLDMFNNLQVLNWKGEDITKTIKCISGWKISINGILHLWEILKAHEMSFLLTRRVNQDCLENFFGSIRQQGGNCINPTPIQFIRAFKKKICLDMINSGAENCEKDGANMLLKIVDMRDNQTEDTPTNQQPSNNDIPTDYHNSDILEKNFTKYVCGYLVKKCLSIHSCEICHSYAKECEEVDETSLYCFLKAYNHTDTEPFGSLYMPNISFVQYVTSMEILFQKNFEEFATQNTIVQKFISIFKTLEFKHPCQKFPYEYIVKLYARIRVFYTLKYTNRNFAKPNRNRKLIIWKNQ